MSECDLENSTMKGPGPTRAVEPWKKQLQGRRIIQGEQKVPVHLTFTVQSSGAQRLFDHPVYPSMQLSVNLLFLCYRDYIQQDTCLEF